MDWEKYNLISDDFKTAKEIGIAAATLGALARRGLVEIKEGSPKQYRKINSVSTKIYQLCEEYKDSYDTYFTIYKQNNPIGMFCSILNNTIVDCWGNPYDLSNSEKIKFGKTIIPL